MIIHALKRITGIQWINSGQPVVWQQLGPGGWAQGNMFSSTATVMPHAFGQSWPVPIAPLPIADPGLSSVNVNQGSMMKELEDLKKQFDEEKKRTRETFTMNSKEVSNLKDKITTLEVCSLDHKLRTD